MSDTRSEARPKVGCAIIGSGNIGTDLMIKILRYSTALDVKMLIGIDPNSDGLARAHSLGVETTSAGVDGLLADHSKLAEIEIIFDATSASAHRRHAALLQEQGKQVIDLTPAAIGPYVVPSVNLHEHQSAANVNMITCGGQATIPIVYAVSRIARVQYAEMVSSISSKSAGQGTRQNIDEFTQTTARGLETVGGAEIGKAIIILNPADPPLIMRNTVYAFFEGDDESAVKKSINSIVADVQRYVPGYRLKAEPLFESFLQKPLTHPDFGPLQGTKVTVLLEVEGAAHYLPKYAGNLDIMTAAARRVGELCAETHLAKRGIHV